MKQLIDSKEIKKKLNLSNPTLSKMEKEGLPLIYLGKSKRYNIKDVTAWIDEIRSDISNLIIDKVYHNDEISNAFKCSTQGGMRRSHATNTLVIFSDHTTGYYEDETMKNEIGEDILLYTGMGQKGDQDINFGQNRTLNESNENEVPVYLFEAFVPGEHIFKGQVELADDPYIDNQQNRKVWIFPIRVIEDRSIIPEKVFLKKQIKEEAVAKELNNQNLFERAKKAKYAGKRYTAVKTYNRDPYVSEHVKRRAQGYCDLCGKSAPFEDKKGKPYLECHHVKWLSREGEDSIYNAVALDPSCHRKMHILDLKIDVDYLMKSIEKYKENENE